MSFLIKVDLPTPLGPVITQAPPLKIGGRLTVAISAGACFGIWSYRKDRNSWYASSTCSLYHFNVKSHASGFLHRWTVLLKILPVASESSLPFQCLCHASAAQAHLQWEEQRTQRNRSLTMLIFSLTLHLVRQCPANTLCFLCDFLYCRYGSSIEVSMDLRMFYKSPASMSLCIFSRVTKW